ncbi:single-stranded-DNA-specific exonuclease [Ereboglobus sp. PH5-5]|uniref:single-stranded-DNA-specific exonuclease RecJ n=1 Tax=Ereboglobus sp. PH5-5 TaxID=2940529 RepID=UPI002406D8C9|nr:single-stranded-DNA-specific exonuclease RecJ [Ereboglobus sp. PH5-5]MDF9832005.1 single-stranded-DNA-specific exonuclease [Ereboglobus sp. PH5-5]
MRWIYTPFPTAEVEKLSHAVGASPVLAELLMRAGLSTPEEANKFLHPTLSELNDPFLLKNLEQAATRLRTAIANKEEVVVLGDYDVDGVTSTALLVNALRAFGLFPRFIVPRRMEDGYGLSRSAIDRALELGKPQLFIALDCGTNSHEEVAYLISQGIDVLVVDHHRSREKTLEQGILVNPHVSEDEGDEPWRNLCTVGLVFKLAHGLLKLLRTENNETAFKIKLRDSLDLVALGTVADLVPLHGENRILARTGLRILQKTKRPGVLALMQVAGVNPENDIMPVDVSFRLGPRINASGRLADAAISVELMLSDDAEFCTKTAQELDAFNRERQDIERQMTEEAERMVETLYADRPGFVLYSENWHPGVVGIVAGRISRKYHRPTVVLGHETEQAKGSGRSVDGINLVEVLGACAEQLNSWGGHPMAVGVSLVHQNIDTFRDQFEKAVVAHAGSAIPEPTLDIAAWLQPEQVRENLMDEICTLHPFGQGNPEPVFGIRGIVLDHRPDVFKQQHFRFHFDDGLGRRLFGVAWKMAGRIPPVGEPIDIAVKIAWNHFNDRKLLQMELIDWRRTSTQ